MMLYMPYTPCSIDDALHTMLLHAMILHTMLYALCFTHHDDLHTILLHAMLLHTMLLHTMLYTLSFTHHALLMMLYTLCFYTPCFYTPCFMHYALHNMMFYTP